LPRLAARAAADYGSVLRSEWGACQRGV